MCEPKNRVKGLFDILGTTYERREKHVFRVYVGALRPPLRWLHRYLKEQNISKELVVDLSEEMPVRTRHPTMPKNRTLCSNGAVSPKNWESVWTQVASRHILAIIHTYYRAAR